MIPRLRKAWHLLRRRVRGRPGRLHRLVVTKSEWPRGAASPVVLMIDDLTNAWHGGTNSPSWDFGGDWGGALDDPRGALAFLEAGLLREFPEARTTFFVVAGAISAYTHHQPFRYAAPLDATARSAAFFRSLANDPRFELAYHGYNHGAAAARTEDFIQEWRGFRSVDDAVAQTRLGLEIFDRAAGRVPAGGKYGGWDYNEFAADAVSACGFSWWCRDWMPRDATGTVNDAYYEPQLFGANRVIGLPSTIHGHFWDRRQIETLLAKRQIISIEEHIAPLRPDGLVQTPNIVDDMQELRRLYRFLRSKSVWHANCSEIAAYVAARDGTSIYDVAADGFAIQYEGPLAAPPPVTLRIDASAICDGDRPAIAVTDPGGRELPLGALDFDTRTFRHLATVPLVSGSYRVRAIAR